MLAWVCENVEYMVDLMNVSTMADTTTSRPNNMYMQLHNYNKQKQTKKTIAEKNTQTFTIYLEPSATALQFITIQSLKLYLFNTSEAIKKYSS